MIAGVIGNFLVIFNISICLVFFEYFKHQQCLCYYESGDYLKDHDQYLKGDKCMEEWINKREIQFFATIADINGSMAMPFSELLAIVPYLLRSSRIHYMSKMRDVYYDTGKIPKQQIKNCSEKRVLKIFLVLMTVLLACSLSVAILREHDDGPNKFPIFLPNYNIVAEPMFNHGKFIHDEFKLQIEKGCFIITCYSLVEYLCLFWAIYI